MDTVDPRMLEAGPSSPTTKLKLTIPSLKALRERADSIKSRDSPVLESAGVTKKTPRPPKLKPLREVLTVLIVKIKKKDDYAFFLKPVDTNAIPGYTDVIQRPMDFGTMTTKIERGRYRSLEEFASDFRLVISNAKTFNPPGTIYYTEAERIDAWASEQISRASAQVIEYETDWNIDVVHDEPPDGADDDDPDDDTGARDETATPSRHSPSNLPNGGSGAAAGRRRGKAESAKPGLADALEPDGHLPGWKDGLSAFPPGSDLAETMVTLKLKGKRYKTKKERLRIERGGLPYAADGSLDYSELEDPFTILSALVPDPPLSRPLLRPLYDPPPPTELYPAPPPVNQSIPDPLPLPKPPSSLPAGQRYRHWAVTRTGPTRRLKEKDAKEGDIEETPIDPRPPRPPTATDFGIYATLMSQLFEQPERLLSESALFDELIKRDVVGGDVEARAAQAWVLEVVYGGVEGLAYLRSLAEFLSSKESQRYSPALGMSLASYVESHVVDDITRSTHRTLHAIAAHLSPSKTPLPINLARAIALLPLRARIDLAALIRNPQELYEAENAVAGLSVTESLTRVGKLLGLLVDRQKLGETHDVMMTDGLVDAAKEIDAAKEVNAAKEDIFTGVRQEEEEGEDEGNVEKSKDVKMEVDEDAAQRVIRLNLIALAKRVPIEQIAPMPAALLPAHVQGVVPTLEALKSDART